MICKYMVQYQKIVGKNSLKSIYRITQNCLKIFWYWYIRNSCKITTTVMKIGLDTSQILNTYGSMDPDILPPCDFFGGL